MDSKTTPKIEVGSVIRIKGPSHHAAWTVTGVHWGASCCEHLVSLRRIDINPGSAFGKVQTETIVPLSILSTHPEIENP